MENIRKDFPILKRQIHNKPLIYFDNAATSQKPNQVVDAISDYYKNYNANVHRGVHKLSEEATEAYEASRKKIANFVNAGDSRQIVFVRNATEAINLVAYSWGRKNIKKDDEIILTEMEHHSNLVPWQILAKEVGAKLKFIPVKTDGGLEVSKLGELVTSKTKLVALAHVSNVLGTINPAKQIISEIKHQTSNIKILVDGAQAVPHTPVSIQSIDPDFYVFTGHKMLGPTGIGVLYGKKELLEGMQPFLYGGEMIREVKFDDTKFNDLPWKFEAGTMNIAEAIGLSAAIGYLNKIGMNNVQKHDRELVGYAMKQLKGIDGIKIYGPDERDAVISFNLGNIHAHDVAQVLDSEGVAIRAGHHCCMPLMSVLGVPATARASFYLYNTEKEIDIFIKAIEKVKKVFG